MPADSDHIRRDALHAARSETRIELMRFMRRIDSEAKAHIDSALATAEGVVDGTSIGREAARAAIANYLAPGGPSATIEAPARPKPKLGKGA